MTMFAKANRGRVNYSNNPTFFEYNQKSIEFTGSQIYEENPNKKYTTPCLLVLQIIAHHFKEAFIFQKLYL